jgi:glyoxylase-like metal-dependent hydrolase (beta-lactamase superfamily II)
MQYATRADNVYMIDTKMFGFDNYSSCYIVQGKKTAMVDTGMPNQFEALRAGLKAHGFTPRDIDYIFVTHEHGDHFGNVPALLKENPEATVYIHPAAVECLTDPGKERDFMKGKLPPQMIARFGELTVEPVPQSRIQFVKDGDVFDLGNGEKLRIMFAPGHQPGNIVIFEEKNGGLFISDLVGNYFADADVSMILTPPNSDLKASITSLKMLMDMPITKLFLGHFGISDTPKEVMQRAMDGMQQFLDIGAQCVAEGKPEEIEPRVTAVKMLEAEKLRAARGQELYEYTSEELIPFQSKLFAQSYVNRAEKS